MQATGRFRGRTPVRPDAAGHGSGGRIGRRRFVTLGAAGGAMGLLAACNAPRNAARLSEILASAEDDPYQDYAIYPVTRDLLPRVETWPVTGSGPRGGWISRGGGANGQTIASGDRLTLTIWDNEENSLLTSNGNKAVTMEGVAVAPDGTIFVPYIGQVRVAGATAEAARGTIQTRLEEIVPSAQVQLAQEAGRMNSVDVVAGVAAPRSYPLEDRNTSVLSLIARAGGVREGLDNPVVRLVRGGQVHVTTLEQLYENPALDTVLRGGDKIIVEEDPRYFLAIGATGRQQQVRFTRQKLMAADAIALMGGVHAGRADPRGLLILREYPEGARGDGIRGPEQARAIFIVDLTSADGLFSAGRFEIHPDDILYASESPLNAVYATTNIIGTFLGLATRIDNSTD